ncbi:MAG TPA: peptidoglycan-binding domain-containing protein [Alphaproteobacteria bacterium]|nr:peptidoglycan-binding domain-containing protein [Alphaproteobacteria bacterium]
MRRLILGLLAGLLLGGGAAGALWWRERAAAAALRVELTQRDTDLAAARDEIASLAGEAANLAEELEKLRLPPLAGEAKTLPVDPKHVIPPPPEAPRMSFREAQERLQRLGFYKGPLDGIPDRGTADAIAAFQRSKKLEPSAILTPETIEALRGR